MNTRARTHIFTLLRQAVHRSKASFARRLRGSILAVMAGAVLLAGTAPAQTASSVAFLTVGSGFNGPVDMAPDGKGNVYVIDRNNGLLKEIVAINGRVSATSTVVILVSGLNQPWGVVVDSKGDVFFSDTNNNLVKELVATNGAVSSTSTIITVGSGFNGPYGLAVDSNGDIFVADANNNAVKEIVAVNGMVSSSSTVIAVGGGFCSPHAVALDGFGNVFVADQCNHAIKEIVAVNGVVSSSSTIRIVGSGFFYPTGVEVDASGNVYVADFANHAMKIIVAVNGVVSSSSTINYLPGFFYYPTGVKVDANGNIFVADAATNRVTENIGQPWQLPTTAVGSTSGSVPVFFTFNNGGTLASTPYRVLTQGNLNGEFQAAATQDSIACVTGKFYNGGDNCTVEVTFAPTRPGPRVGAVQLIGANGTPIATGNLYGTGTAPLVTFSPPTQRVVGSGFNDPTIVAFDGSGDVFVTTPTNPAVSEVVAVNGVVSSTSTIVTVGGGFNNPYGVAVDGSGNIFVADTGNNAVKEIVAINGAVSPTSTVITVNSSFGSPTGVAVDKSGNVFVADAAGAGALYEIVAVNGVVSSSSVVNTIGSGFSSPHNLAVDASGNVYVADFGNSAVKEVVAVNGFVSFSSTVNTIGNGFINPTDVEVVGDGSIVVADYGNNAVKEIIAVNGAVSSSSTVQTLASGLNSPQGVAVNGRGNVIVAETNQDQVTELDVATPPALSFATTNVGLTSPDSPQTVTITNRGNAPLTFEIPTTGQNPSISASFTLDNSSTCPLLTTSSSAATLAAGALCTEVVNFIPAASGNISGSLAITDNNLNAAGPSYVVQSIALSGTGTMLAAVKVTTSAIPSTVVSGSNLGTVIATIKDANGNTVTGSSAAVTVTITGPGGYSQTVPATAVNGVATFNLSSLSLTAEGIYTVTTSSPGLTEAISTVTVTAGAAVEVATSTIPPTVAFAGNLGTVIATIKDANGNTVTSSSASVAVTITGPNGYSQQVTVNAADGIAIFDLASLTFSTAGSYTITTTSGGLTQSVGSFTVTASPAALLALPAIPGTIAVGDNLGVVPVSVESSSGSVVTSSSASITVTITGPNGYSQQVMAAAVNGIANFNLSSLTFSAAGSYTITATSSGLTQASAPFTVTASTTQAAKLALPAIPATVAVGDSLGAITVSVETSAGSVATSSSAVVIVTITGPNGYSQQVMATAVNGIAILNLSGLTFSAAGTYTITGTSIGLTQASASFTVTASAAQAAQLVLPAIPAIIAAGENLGAVPVSIETSSGSVVTTSTALVTITISFPDGSAQVFTATAVNGIATFNLSSLTLSLPDIYLITATSIGLNPAIAVFTVTSSAADATQLVLPAIPPTVNSGGNLGTIAVSVETTAGAVVTGSTASITVTITGPGGYSQQVTVSAVNGVATFDLTSFTFATPGTYTVTVSSTGLTSAVATFTIGQNFTLTPSAGTGPTPTQDVLPGAAAVYQLQLAPAGAIFNAPITLSATGLPPGATYTFNPAVVTPGTAAATSTFTVNTAPATASLRPRQNMAWGFAMFLPAAFLLPWAGSRNGRRKARWFPVLPLLLVGLALGIGSLSGCGAGGLFSQPQTTYTITVTGTSGALTHSTTVTLTVQ
ncbi:MAG: hypothetical protein ABSF59_02500 [Candidatus Sulfotelmatobacter sp.]|jgi:sugar lactone lactonase YvrE/23S rRNA pseudoU1915 N3-methylase RlmH